VPQSAFLWDDKAAGATLSMSYGTVATSMPLTNLADPQPRLRARVTGLESNSSCGIWLDFGAPTAIDAVAVISTTLSADASIRILINDNSTGSFPFIYNSGQVAAGITDECGGNVIFVLPSTQTQRYLRVDLWQTGTQIIDIGRIVAGPLLRPARTHAYGIVEGRQINDRVDANPLTGARFPVPALANPRFAKFTLPLLTTAEARGEFRSLTRTLGGVGDLLWIPDTSLSQAELNARSLYGAANAPGDLAGASRDNFVASSRSFSITERV
jgi:hypothetical protein